MVWDEPAETMVRELAAKGKSASQIAAAIGGVTRNAVIGMASRRGIKLGFRRGQNDHPTGEKAAKRRRRAPAKKAERRDKRMPASVLAWRQASSPIMEGAAIAAPMIDDGEAHVVGWPIWHPRLVGCRYVISDGDCGPGRHLCCGLPQTASSSYCASHHKMTHTTRWGE